MHHTIRMITIFNILGARKQLINERVKLQEKDYPELLVDKCRNFSIVGGYRHFGLRCDNPAQEGVILFTSKWLVIRI